MSFKIIRNDITKVKADAIVNTANRLPCIGKGTDSAVYAAAGKENLLEARKKIGIIDPGQSAVTSAYDLTEKNGVRYIIHTVGIKYKDGSYGERTILRSCYSNSLKLARRLKCSSIAFPLLSSGHFNFPKGTALDIAIDEIEDFLSEYDMDVTLVVYDEESFMLSEKLTDDLQSFIDANYIEENISNENQSTRYEGEWLDHVTYTREQLRSIQIEDEKKVAEYKDRKTIEGIGIDAFVEGGHQVMDFKNLLQKLIADRNISNAEAYRGTYIDRKYFSKIISPKNMYLPKKSTVIQLGISLKLSIADFENLLATANYALNPHLKQDLVIRYCMEKGGYSVVKVDSILMSMGLPCLYDENF